MTALGAHAINFNEILALRQLGPQSRPHAYLIACKTFDEMRLSQIKQFETAFTIFAPPMDEFVFQHLLTPLRTADVVIVHYHCGYVGVSRAHSYISFLVPRDRAHDIATIAEDYDNEIDCYVTDVDFISKSNEAVRDGKIKEILRPITIGPGQMMFLQWPSYFILPLMRHDRNFADEVAYVQIRVRNPGFHAAILTSFMCRI